MGKIKKDRGGTSPIYQASVLASSIVWKRVFGITTEGKTIFRNKVLHFYPPQQPEYNEKQKHEEVLIISKLIITCQHNYTNLN